MEEFDHNGLQNLFGASFRSVSENLPLGGYWKRKDEAMGLYGIPEIYLMQTFLTSLRSV
jgi:hypothetical protein